MNLIIVIKRKEHALLRPYQTLVRARVMGEVEEVQEKMKADTEALKEQMATMMEAMISIKEIMEVSAAAIAATSTIVEVDLTPSYVLNQINHPTSDMVGLEGKELGGTGGTHLVRKTSMPSHHMACLPTIHHRIWRTLLVRMSITSSPILIESR